MMMFNPSKSLNTIQKRALERAADSPKAVEVFAINIYSYFMDIKEDTPINKIAAFHRCDEATATDLKAMQLAIKAKCDAGQTVPQSDLDKFIDKMQGVIETQWALNSQLT